MRDLKLLALDRRETRGSLAHAAIARARFYPDIELRIRDARLSRTITQQLVLDSGQLAHASCEIGFEIATHEAVEICLCRYIRVDVGFADRLDCLFATAGHDEKHRHAYRYSPSHVSTPA